MKLKNTINQINQLLKDLEVDLEGCKVDIKNK